MKNQNTTKTPSRLAPKIADSGSLLAQRDSTEPNHAKLTGHTPGPWCKARTSNGWSIGRSGDCVAVTDGPDDSVAKANASLIAAAPELLEALRAALPVIDDAFHEAKSRPGYERVAESFKAQADSIRAATSKSEGK